MSDYTTNKYFVCDIKENPEHLILYCKATYAIREELKQEFNTKSGQEFLFKFLEKNTNFNQKLTALAS